MVVTRLFLDGLGVRADVHQQKAARAVGVLCLPFLKAALPEQGGLLVACHAADWDACRDVGIGGHAEVSCRGPDLGHHAGGDAEQLEQLAIPAALVDVVEHGAARVGDVGRVHLAAGQVPDKPAVDGAKQQFAALRALAGALDVVEQPLDLARREVRVGMQAGLCHDSAARPLRCRRALR